MDTFHQARVSDSHAEVLASRLGRLVRLEFELGVAETRDFVRGIGAAIVISVVAAIALISSLVVLAGRRTVAAVRRTLGTAADRRRRRDAAECLGPGLERVAAHASVVAHRDAHVFRGELAMARSPAEIQADIALTRRVIERQLDTPDSTRRRARGGTRGRSPPGRLGVGLALAQVPLLRVVVGGRPRGGGRPRDRRHRGRRRPLRLRSPPAIGGVKDAGQRA